MWGSCYLFPYSFLGFSITLFPACYLSFSSIQHYQVWLVNSVSARSSNYTLSHRFYHVFVRYGTSPTARILLQYTVCWWLSMYIFFQAMFQCATVTACRVCTRCCGMLLVGTDPCAMTHSEVYEQINSFLRPTHPLDRAQS